MTWDVFFEHLVTSNSIWFARFSVAPWWSWGLGVMLAGIGLLALFSKRVGAFHDKDKGWRLCIQGVVISFISWLLLAGISVLLSPKIMLQKIFLNINSFWQLSPKGVTEVLEFLTWMGYVKIGLLIVIIVWFIVGVWNIIIEWRKNSASEKPPVTVESPSTTAETGSDYSYVLILLAAQSGEIERTEFENGISIEPGDYKIIEPGEKLYFKVSEEQRVVKILEEKPIDYDAELLWEHDSDSQWTVSFVDKTGDEESHSSIQFGKNFLIHEIKFIIDRVPSTDLDKGKSVGTLKYAAVATGFALFLLAVTFIPIQAAHNRIMLDGDIPNCFKGTSLSVAYTELDSWHIAGTLTTKDPDDIDSSNYKFQIFDKHLGVIKTKQSKLKKNTLFLNLVFDLDSAAIYEKNDKNLLVSQETNAISIEKKFWMDLITKVLASFQEEISKENIEKVVVSVSTTYRCQIKNSEKGLHFLGNVELTGATLSHADIVHIENAINCGYQLHQEDDFEDISAKAWRGEKYGESNNNRAMIIVRWHKDTLYNDSYAQAKPQNDSVPPSKIIILDIHRGHTGSVKEINKHPVIQITAPNKGDLSPSIPWQNIQKKVEKMVVDQADSIELSAVVKQPKLIDLEVATEKGSTLVKLVDKDDKVKCLSDDLSLDFITTSGHNDRSWPPKLILFLIFFLTLLFSSWSSMVVIILIGGFIEKISDSW